MLHPLALTAPLPPRLNNPFDYEPEAYAKAAATLLQAALRGDVATSEYGIDAAFREEIAHGKMFGVLIVADAATDEVGYLAAFSGQILGRSDWPGFVPAVFDYLRPDGYFKTHEAEISRINAAIARLEADEPMRKARKLIEELNETRRQTIENYQRQMKEAKARRDERRATATLTPEEERQLIGESQFMKAELRRLKQSLREETPLEAEYRRYEADLQRLRQLRRTLSDALQRWLFSQFRMRSWQGEEADLLAIWSHGDTPTDLPPAGSGECCEPKLLQYAFTHGLRPLQMAMFWWGQSPKEEIRHHLHFYPACNGKCKPILRFMFGDDFSAGAETADEAATMAPQPMADAPHTLPELYADATLAALDKPAGLLSVPGKQTVASVYTVARRMYPHAEGPLLPHRLDMSTSGIVLVAKSDRMFHALQDGFLHHQIHKSYVALVSPQPSSPLLHGQTQGVIGLPLAPDYLDRPRQRVDHDHGKAAITHYEVLRREPDLDGQPVYRLMLHPQTGRTHQLRMHCAHAEGLMAPILGDPLYGHVVAPRMCLHATRVDFRHPFTGEEIRIESPVPF